MTDDQSGGREVDRRSTSVEEFEPVFDSLQAVVRSAAASAREPAAPTALVVSCSMCPCESPESLWPLDPLWTVVGVSTLGNQTWEWVGDAPVLDGNLAQFTADADLDAVLVVGHTPCEVVTDAYEQYVGPTTQSAPGIETRVRPLVSLVADAFDDGLLDETTPLRTAQSRLVEYNVVRQVGFLRRALPPSTLVLGYVSDEDGAYSSFPGKRYLVALDGETDPAAIRGRLPDDASVRVTSHLSALSRPRSAEVEP